MEYRGFNITVNTREFSFIAEGQGTRIYQFRGAFPYGEYSTIEETAQKHIDGLLTEKANRQETILQLQQKVEAQQNTINDMILLLADLINAQNTETEGE